MRNTYNSIAKIFKARRMRCAARIVDVTRIGNRLKVIVNFLCKSLFIFYDSNFSTLPSENSRQQRLLLKDENI